MKALLQEHGIKFPKTHDLESLIDLLIPTFPQFTTHRIVAKILTAHAVEVRYPGTWATRVDAEGALATAKAIRKTVRLALGFNR